MRTGDMKISAFLDALAARESTPGGGGAAALTGSQAAALLSMVVRFTLGNPKYAAVEVEMQGFLEESETLRRELLALADADVAAFEAVAATYAMPRGTDAEKAARTAAMQQALKGATAAPFQTAERCLAVIQLAAPVGAKGNSNVVSDAATALYLAMAALRAAILNVNFNLKSIKDADFVAEWSSRRDQLLVETGAAYELGRAACEKTLDMIL
jgi:formiminotetrahydrofolate cyclodeaminase